MVFGDRLRMLREEKELSQEELVKHFEVDRATISRYEKGNRQPDFSTSDKLADYFNCSVDYILGRSDQRRPEDQPPMDHLFR
jgi:transcriptional regulator with XRE-family HTH domain